jgi:hypothetical protein
MGIKYDGHIKKIVHTKNYNTSAPSIEWIAPPAGDIGNFLGGQVVDIPVYVRVTNGPAPSFSVVSGALPTGLSINANTGAMTGTIDNVTEDAVWTIRAESGQQFVERSFSAHLGANQAPIWVTPAGSLGMQYDGTDVSVQLVATDPDGETVRFSLVTGTLPAGLTLSNTGLLSGRLAPVNDDFTYFFTLRATDGALSVNRSFNFSVTSNKAPVFTTDSYLGRYQENAVVDLNIEATDGNGDTITFTHTSGVLPPELVFDNGHLSGTLALNKNYNDNYSFQVTASDGLKSRSATFSMTTVKNIPPVWVTTGRIIDADAGTSVNFQLVATDEYETVTFGNTTPLPEGLSLSSSGLITGTLPPVTSTSTQNVTFTATDESGLVATRTLAIRIQFVDVPTWISNSNIGSALEGTEFSFQFVADTANPSDSITYSSDDMPDGFSLSSTGLMTGTALPVISDLVYNFTVTASNPAGSISKLFNFTVLDDIPPVWVSNAGSLGSFPASNAITDINLTATDPNNRPMTYAYVSGDLVPGLVYAYEPSGIRISGTPSHIEDDTTYTVTFRASDGVNNVNRTFSMTILGNNLPEWQTPAGSLGQGVEQTYFTANVSATDPDGDTVRYGVAQSFSLPVGISLNANTGALTGYLPPVPGTDDYVYSFRLTAMDNKDNPIPVYRDFTIESKYDSPPVFVTTTLPSVLVDKPYTAQIVATGTNTGNIAYSVVSGELPTGLVMEGNGLIHGTPTVFGTELFTVEAYNGIKSSTRQFSIEVEENTPPYWIIPAGSIGAYRANHPFSVQLVADDNEESVLKFDTIDTNLPNTITLANGIISGQFAPSESNATYYFNVTVSDEVNPPIMREFEVSFIKNTGPVWNVSNSLGSYQENTTINYVIPAATDLDLDTLTYAEISNTFPAGITFNPATRLVSGTLGAEPTSNVYTLVASVTDGFETVQKTFDFEVKHNVSPVWTSNAYMGSFRSGYPGSFTPTAYDPDSTMTYSVISTDIPGWMRILPGSKTVETIPQSTLPKSPPLDEDTDYHVTFRASDGNTYEDKAFYFTVLKNEPAVFNTVANTVVFNDFEGRSVSYQVDAYDPESEDSVYFYGTLPAGLSISTSGLITGTLLPVLEDTDYSFYVSVKDQPGEFSVNTNSVLLRGTTLFNSAPSWVTPAGSLGTEGQEKSVSIQLTAVANGDPIEYTIANGALPVGLTLNANGLITGTTPVITQDTTYNFSARATDTLTTKYTDREFSYTIALNRAPVWNQPAGLLVSSLMDYPFTATISATDPDGDALTLVEMSNSFPSSITFNPNTGVISGTMPVVGANTTYSLSVGAFDGSIQVNRTFTFLNRYDSAPVWNTNAGIIGTGTENKPFSYHLSATDLQGSSVAYSANIVNNPFPSSLGLLANGYLIGALPDVSVDTVYTFDVDASDGRYKSTRSFSLDVKKNVGPVWVTPAGDIGTFQDSANVSVQLSATDADNDVLTYALVNGTTLPAALTLSSSGLISGIPVNIETLLTPSIDVRVTDEDGNFADRTFTMTVLPSADKTDVYSQQVVFLAQFNDTIALDFFGTAITAGGSASLATSEVQFGAGSLSLPTTTSYASVAYDANYNLNLANTANTVGYTIDGWVKVSNLPSSGNYGYIFSKKTATDTDYVALRVNSDGQLEFISHYLGAGGSTVFATSNAISDWTHIAYVIQGSNVSAYVDGYRIGTYFITRTAINSAFVMGDSASGVVGYIDDLRMTNAARYTTPAFTLPTDEVPTIPYWTTPAGTILTGTEDNTFTYNLVAVDSNNTGTMLYIANSTLGSNVALASNGLVSGRYLENIENTSLTVYSMDGLANKSRDRTFVITPTAKTVPTPYASNLYIHHRYNRSSNVLAENGSRPSRPTSISDTFTAWGVGVASGATIVADPQMGNNVLRLNQGIAYEASSNFLYTSPSTLEFWVKLDPTSPTTGSWYLFSQQSSGGGSGTLGERMNIIQNYTNNTITFSYFGTVCITVNSIIPLDQWTHVALTRNANNTFSLFIGGTLVGTSTAQATYPSWEGRLLAFNGASQSYNQATQSKICYMRGMMTWVGYTRYTANFTPSWNNFKAPLMNATVTLSGYEYANVSQTVVGYGWGNTSLTYSANGLSANLALSANGLISGRLPEYTTVSNATVTGSDGMSSAVTNVVYSILSSAPVWANTSNTFSGINGALVNSQLLATSPVSNPLSYALANGSIPNGLTLSNTGLLSGQINENTTSTFNFTTRVTDTVTTKFSDKDFRFGVTASDIYGSNVIVLMNMNTEYATANVPNELSNGLPVSQFITSTSNASVSSSQSKFGTGSLFVNSTNALRISNVADLVGDFTLETWVYPTTLPSSGTAVFSNRTGSNVANKMYVWIGQTGIVNLDGNDNSNSFTQNFGAGVSKVNLNAWSHIALVRQSGVFKVYVNGVLELTKNGWTSGAISPSTYWAVGSFRTDAMSNPSASLYFDDVRFTNGVARYTANFTAPTVENDTSFITPVMTTNVVTTYTTSDMVFFKDLGVVNRTNLPVTFGVTSGSLANGLVINSNGVITGTLGRIGNTSTVTSNAVVTMTDSYGRASSKSVSIVQSDADPLWSNVTILMNMDQTIGTAPADIKNSAVITQRVVSSTTGCVSNAVTKFGGKSLLTSLTTTSNYLNIGNITTMSGDFTIETWVYPTGVYSTSSNLLSIRSGSAASSPNEFVLGIHSSNALFLYFNSGYQFIGAANSMPLNTWHHIAVTRESGILKLWLNGSLIGSSAVLTGVIGSTVTAWTIGGSVFDGADWGWIGYVDEFRMTNGVARYRENFAVPSKAFPTEQTTLRWITAADQYVTTAGDNQIGLLADTKANGVVTYSIANGSALPSGMTVAANGMISGQPVSTGVTNTTITASGGNGFVTQDRTFTFTAVSTYDPFWANVTNLTYSNAVVGSIAKNVKTANSLTQTAASTTVGVNSNTVQRFGSNTMVFSSATNSYLVGNTTAMTGDFTMEAWFYPTTLAAWSTILGNRTTATATGTDYTIGVRDDASGPRGLYMYNNGAFIMSSGTGTVAVNTWHHFAITRTGTTLSMFLNGNRVAQATLAGTITFSGIGGMAYSNECFNGYIYDVRVTNGVNRYPSTTMSIPTTSYPRQDASPTWGAQPRVYLSNIYPTYTTLSAQSYGENIVYSMTNSAVLPDGITMTSNGVVGGKANAVAGTFTGTVNAKYTNAPNASVVTSSPVTFEIRNSVDPHWANVTALITGLNTANATVPIEVARGSTVLQEVVSNGSAVVSNMNSLYNGNVVYFQNSTGSGNGRGLFVGNIVQMSGDFTMEAWVYPTGVAATANSIIFACYPVGGSVAVQNWAMSIYAPSGSSSARAVIFTNGGVRIYTAAGGMSFNQWHHVALTREGSNTRIWVDGVGSDPITSFTGTVGSSTNEWGIGSYRLNNNHGFMGYMADIRISNGVARYNTTFNPTQYRAPTLDITPSFVDTNSIVVSSNVSSTETYNLSASMMSNDAVIHSVTSGTIPTGTTLNSNGILTGVTTDVPGTTRTFTVSATNGAKTNTTTVTANVTASIDPYWSNVVIHVNGDSGAVGSLPVDNKGNLITRNYGSTTTGVVSNAVTNNGFGNSIFITSSGTNQFLKVENAVAMSGDFTMEAWINATSFQTYNAVLTNYISPAGSGDIFFGVKGSNLVCGNTLNEIIGTSTLIPNAWYHIALTRSGGTTRMFLNGKLEATSTNAVWQVPIGGRSTSWSIGGYENTPASWNWWGYIDDVRITNGVARYIANFVPRNKPNPIG